MHVGEQGVHTPLPSLPPPPPTSALSVLMHGIISLADATSYDNVLFAAVRIVA